MYFRCFLGAKFGSSSPRIPLLATRFFAAPRDAEFGSKPLKDRVLDFQISHDFAIKLQIPLHFAEARPSRIVSGYRERRAKTAGSQWAIGLGPARCCRGFASHQENRHVLLDPPAAPGLLSARSRASIAAERKNYDAQAEGAELEFPRGSIVGEATELAYSRSRPSIPQSRRDRCQGSRFVGSPEATKCRKYMVNFALERIISGHLNFTLATARKLCFWRDAKGTFLLPRLVRLAQKTKRPLLSVGKGAVAGRVQVNV
jgi:hypothetical protein